MLNHKYSTHFFLSLIYNMSIYYLVCKFLRYIKYWSIVNIPLLVLGLIFGSLISSSDMESLLMNFFVILVKNIVLLFLVKIFTSKKSLISPRDESETFTDYVYLISSTIIETFTHPFLTHSVSHRIPFMRSLARQEPLIGANETVHMQNLKSGFISIYEILSFIPKTFAFEVIFDLFHYITHRISHSNKYLYMFHKIHHLHAKPVAVKSFTHHPIDLLLSNSIPMIITSKLISLTKNQLNIFLIYKTFIEIAGHSGHMSHPSSSFPQFIFIPKLLGIEYYTEDHDMHHLVSKGNYAKRFKLWDVVFGTYIKKQ